MVQNKVFLTTLKKSICDIHHEYNLIIMELEQVYMHFKRNYIFIYIIHFNFSATKYGCLLMVRSRVGGDVNTCLIGCWIKLKSHPTERRGTCKREISGTHTTTARLH